MVYKIKTELMGTTIVYYFDNEVSYNRAASIENSPDSSTEQMKHLASYVIIVDHLNKNETLLKSRYADTLEHILDYYVGDKDATQ